MLSDQALRLEKVPVRIRRKILQFQSRGFNHDAGSFLSGRRRYG
jgi:hypothetical protein